MASKEYFNAVDPNKIEAQIISPIFKDYRNGKLKIISFTLRKLGDLWLDILSIIIQRIRTYS